MNKEHVTILVLLDLSAAFDTVDHSILHGRLSSKLGLNGTALAWFRSYLSGRSQRVSVRGTVSDKLDLRYGVPEGSCLGPLLFTVYACALFDVVEKHLPTVHCYADDSQLDISFSPMVHSGQADAVASIEHCIQDIKQWVSQDRPDQDGIRQIIDHYGSLARIENSKCDGTHYQDIRTFRKTESGYQSLSCDPKEGFVSMPARRHKFIRIIQTFTKDNADDHMWLAEFAVGYINDAIQKQYMDGNGDSKKKYGYGNCQRLVGKSFVKVVKRFLGEYIVTTMDIHAVPPVGFTDDEVYRLSVRQFAKPTQGVIFLSFIRKTMYNKFASCTDNSVEIKLCTCAKGQTADASKKEVLFDNGIPRKMFGSDTVVRDLNSNCLLFLQRNYRTFSFALGVANVCTNVTYTFELTGSIDQKIFSKTLPIERELPSKTFYFLTSVHKYISKVNKPVGLKESVQVKKDGSDTFNNLRVFIV
ncbi:hypothetical protein AWC38_SpisGene22065 [Stylophora pistillata]|uniref:Reverse transcriptase domain-containing protein n=1 Tax=Stylophora pistillata TaxID=50429 RepID=A0A2B4RAI1_STYPI|nr:hypothetical protein AWC38_SpisGene22065 [Stylophora pistillata]